MSSAAIQDIDLKEFMSDPYPTLKYFRKNSPIAYVPQLNATLFSKHQDIFICEKNVEIFSSVQPDGLMTKLMGQNMMRKDGDAHITERKAIFPTVSPKTVKNFWKNQFVEKTNKIINVKKGQFLAPWDMINVTKKISDSGNNKILITERGASFGYNTLVSDMRSLPIMSKLGYPIVFDATHSVQQPGGLGNKSGGEREFVSHLSRAAVAVGVAAVFIETHQDPDNAPSDGPNMIPLNELDTLLDKLVQIDRLIKN